MLRKLTIAVGLTLVLCVGVALADEAKGRLKSLDPDKGIIVVTVDNKATTYRASMLTKVLDADGKDLADGLRDKNLKEGADVILVYDKAATKRQQILLKEIRLGKK